jgi:hypothetical protein
LEPGSADCISEEDRARLVEAVTVRQTGGGQFPSLPLLRDRELAVNRIDSFLVWRPMITRVLGEELGALIAPANLGGQIREQVRRLVENPNDLNAWIELECMVGELDPPDDLRGSVATAIERADFSGIASPREHVRELLLAFSFICRQQGKGEGRACRCHAAIRRADARGRAGVSKFGSPRSAHCTGTVR